MQRTRSADVPRGPLWELIKGVSSARGEEFFRELTRRLADALGVRYAMLSELVSKPSGMRSLAVWDGDAWADNFDYDLTGTPCGRVVAGRDTLVHGSDVRLHFPAATLLSDWGINCYLGAPLRGASGEVIGTLCVMDPRPLDDDERARVILEPLAARAAIEVDRMRSEREIEQQRAFLRQILDINPCFVFAKDREGRFTLVNESVAEAYGTTVEDLLGKTDADFNPNEEEVAFFRKMDLEVMDTQQERFIQEEPVTDSTGQVRWVQTIKRPIVDADGTANQVLGVATDITELKRAQEDLLTQKQREHEQVQDELAKVEDELVRQTRLAAIGQVAASIAHDLRNPLGAISNAAFYLKRHVPDMEAKWSEYLDIIRQELHVSDQIVRNLLEMTRAKKPLKQPVDLRLIVNEAFEPIGCPASVSLELELAERPFMVLADAGQLRQVLTNLLTNAVQAMPDGGEIRIEARGDGDHDVITVRDQGPGIPPDARDNVFEPLFTTKAKGTGLGLAICRQIVAGHGGTIELLPSESGAVFRFRLPHNGDSASESEQPS